MKKLLSIFLAAMLVLSLTACGGKDDPKPSGNSGAGNTPPASTQQEQPSAAGFKWSDYPELAKVKEYTGTYTFESVETDDLGEESAYDVFHLMLTDVKPEEVKDYIKSIQSDATDADIDNGAQIDVHKDGTRDIDYAFRYNSLFDESTLNIYVYLYEE